jgi:hypothetical protein
LDSHGLIWRSCGGNLETFMLGKNVCAGKKTLPSSPGKPWKKFSNSPGKPWKNFFPCLYEPWYCKNTSQHLFSQFVITDQNHHISVISVTVCQLRVKSCVRQVHVDLNLSNNQFSVTDSLIKFFYWSQGHTERQ